MAKELGRIQKPRLDGFKEGRKLYCVPLLPYSKDMQLPEEYDEKVSLYWQQVADHVANLENVGKVAHVFHESVAVSGNDAVELIKRINEKGHEFVAARVIAGAALQALEDTNLLDEYLDWSLCLSVVGRSLKVAQQVGGLQAQAAENRDEHIAKTINGTLRKNEAGLLVMSDDSRIRIQPKISSDIQIFLVHPPALNDVQRWLREYMLTRAKRDAGYHADEKKP